MKQLSLLALAVVAGSSMAQSFKGYQSEITPVAKIHFVATPGVREFSGQMLVRPVQIQTWKRMGQTQLGAEANRLSAQQRIGDLMLSYVEQLDVYLIRVPQGKDENSLAKELMKTGLYEYVEPNYTVYPAFVPNDPMLNSQWSQTNNQATEAWDICRGNANLTIGITDTGIHLTHEDLVATRVLGANSFTATTVNDVKTEAVFGSSIVKDLNQHGTHCTGIAAAIGNNGKGVTGANIEGTKHLMVRVSDFSSGGSSVLALSLGALWAASNGCRVVSTSYSSVQDSLVNTTGTTIKNTYNAVYCYAAGNDGGTYGAQFDWPNVTIVGSNESNNVISGFSARGEFIDVMAPGGDILSTLWQNDAIINSYGNLSGTSMATPYAAGTAMMILAQNPNYTAQRVENILYRTCINQGAAGTYGWGRVNLWNAMGRKANSMALVPGKLASGVLADLWRIEGNKVVVKPGLVANNSIPSIQVETVHNVPAYANNNFGEIDIMTTIKVTGATGSYLQNLMIFNNSTGKYETVATGNVDGSFFEGVFPVNSGNFANYIVGGTVKVKVQVYPNGPISGPNYQAEIDQINVRTLRATQ